LVVRAVIDRKSYGGVAGGLSYAKFSPVEETESGTAARLEYSGSAGRQCRQLDNKIIAGNVKRYRCEITGRGIVPVLVFSMPKPRPGERKGRKW
jgi:hypothetical protein